MFKKLTFVVMACLLSVAVNAQEWIGFGGRAEGSPLEINLQRNDNQTVSFTVSLSGMYVESRTEGSDAYKRLSMPQCYSINFFHTTTTIFCTFASINNQQNIIDNEVKIRLLYGL